MRRPLLDQIWDDMSELDKFSLYHLIKKAAPQSKSIKTTSCSFCGSLVVFNGRIWATTGNSAFWKDLGYADFVQYHNRCVELLFHPDSHLELEKIITKPGSSGKLTLFFNTPKGLKVHVRSQEITSFSNGEGIGLEIRPADLLTWQRVLRSKLRKTTNLQN